MRTEVDEKLSDLIIAMLQIMSRDLVLNSLKELLQMSDQQYEDLADLCKEIDENQATNQ